MSETEEQRSASVHEEQEEEEKKETERNESRTSSQDNSNKKDDNNEKKEDKKEETKKQETRREETNEKKDGDTRKEKEDKEKEVDNNSQQAKSGGKSPRREEEKRQKEYFRNELKRLQTSLQRESTKIKAPPVRPHFPYVFTNLAPYYNTFTASYLIDTSEENPIARGYKMRQTAIGLIDPWDDLTMDKTMLPVIEKRSPRTSQDKKKPAQKGRERGEGSTRLPKFPAVRLETQELATKKLDYNDVKMLREELRKKYSGNAAAKRDEDYKRTKQDYHRMELDRLDQVHPSNRSHMKSAYFAYLKNTPGSKKAITECVKQTDGELEHEEREREEKRKSEQQRQTVETRS